MQPIGFCFIGAGVIAREFLRSMDALPDVRLVSVVSGRRASAEKLVMDNAEIAVGTFAPHEICRPYTPAGLKMDGRQNAAPTTPTVFDTVDDALACPGVDVVYICSPNHLHKEHTLAAIKHGVPVLCEKPFALTLAETDEMLAAARDADVYLQEAMWMLHNPCIQKALEWEKSHLTGKRTFKISFGNPAHYDPQSRLFNPAMGGGSLYDVGVYGLALAQAMFGAPSGWSAKATKTPSGVDGTCTVRLEYPDGTTGTVTSSLTEPCDNRAVICAGGEKSITIPEFWNPTCATLETVGGVQETTTCENLGYQHEIRAVCDDLRAGRLENAVVSHAFTRDVMEIIDALMKEIA